MPQQRDPRLLLDYQGSDDAGVFRISPECALVQTVDFFTPIVDDAKDFGAIAAANALSDAYAMGATPMTALSIVCFPYRQMDSQVLADICEGGALKIAESGAVVLGGHSVEDTEIKFGYAVTASIHPEAVWHNNTPRPDDVLVLTKPLGTGLLTTAVKQEKMPETMLDAPIEAMKCLNRQASELARAFDVHAATDVTGFGLLGHLYEMVLGKKLGAVIQVEALPLFDGVWQAIASEALTRAHRSNAEYIAAYLNDKTPIFERFKGILLDPQTSGGLLFAFEPEQAQAYVTSGQKLGLQAHIIGRISEKPGFEFH